MTRRTLTRWTPIALAVLVALAGCGGDDDPARPPAASRSYRMGFSPIPPRQDPAIILPMLEMWTRRADAGLMLGEPPWDSMLAGIPTDGLVRRHILPIANYYRSKGLIVVASMDPTNGLDRAADSEALVAAGRSLTETAIQALYRDYVVALDTLVHPDYLSLASETNLVRGLAPPALYAALKQNAADAFTAVRAHDATVRLFATVQVEVAWGPPPAAYVGIAQDLADFAFTEVLGLSSYPYFVWTDPDSLPVDYYSRITAGTGLPAMVIEGGWTSAQVGPVVSTPEKQARYIRRHAAILDAVGAAAAVFQITFTDLDLTGVPLPTGSPLPLFASIGLVDVALNPKPALGEWDAIFARPRR